MQLNNDLIRSLLLEMEGNTDVRGANDHFAQKFIAHHNISIQELTYTVTKLAEADFITGKVRWASDNPYLLMPGNLTYSGHKYLDTIRDPKVWKKTKEITSHIESVSIDIISKVATNVILKQLNIN